MGARRICTKLAEYLDKAVYEDEYAAGERLQKAFDGLKQILPAGPTIPEGTIPKKIAWHGLRIDIENPKGTYREGVDASGKAWRTYMFFDYGYIRRSEGADGEEVDVYCGPNMADAKDVYVIHQRQPPSFAHYDEDKCMVGFPDEAAAQRAYCAQYDDPRFLGPTETFSTAAFVEHVKKHGKAPGTVPDNYLTPLQLLARLRVGSW